MGLSFINFFFLLEPIIILIPIWVLNLALLAGAAKNGIQYIFKG